MTQTFQRKIFTPKLFFTDLTYLIVNIPRILKLRRNKTVNKTMIRKIMMVTSAVNGCVYCCFFHAKKALDMGIDKEEIQRMLNLQFQTHAREKDLMALLYAQHYAETNRNPDPDMTKKLMEYYGERSGEDIILAIRMITFGNLYGNTWDAILSRIKGIPAQNGSLPFEIIFFLVNFPVMIPAMIVMRIHGDKTVMD